MKRPDHWFGTLAITIMLFLVPSVGQALPVGDVTCDGAVDVLDVVALVNVILSGEALEACDEDGASCGSIKAHCEALLPTSPDAAAFYSTDQEMEYGIDGCLAYCDGDSQGVSETIAELDYDSEVEAAEEACMVFCYETLGIYGTAPLSSVQACWETCVEDQSGDVWSCAVGF